MSLQSRDLALFRELLRRDLLGRYRGSFGGIAWAFVQPLFLLVVYTFAFGVVAGLRWQNGGNVYEFGLYVFAGLIVYNAFSECITRSPNAIVANTNYVKKVLFPLHLLPLVVATSAWVHAAIGLLIWFAVYVFVAGTPQPSSLYSFALLALCLPALMGLALLLSAVGTFFRDLAQLCVVISHALLFLTPVFYGVEHLAQPYRSVLEWNPLTSVITSLRSVLLNAASPDYVTLALVFACFLGLSVVAFLVFRALRPRFVDGI
jgi:lipopolysaccharide transport system permease protein